MNYQILRKKIILFLCFILIFFNLFLLTNCKKENPDDKKEEPVIEETIDQLTIYTVNDFHGAIKDKASRVAEYIMSNTSKNPKGSIVLSAGDMSQGTGISNLNHGKDMINIMNLIGFDSMTVGNHEFDWDIKTMLAYFDGDESNGEANFPFLGCNVIDKTTNQRPLNMDEYTIIERGGLKIAIIGYIGLGLESDIATSMIENYEFVNPYPIIKNLSYDLRVNQKVNIVVACGHDASSNMNQQIAELSGDYRVDAIVNGHSHSKANGTFTRTNDNINVPYVQAGSSGSHVGKIVLNIDPNTKIVTGGNAFNTTITQNAKENSVVKTYVDDLVSSTAEVFERVIGTAGSEIDYYKGLQWAVDAMDEYCVKNYEHCDLAFTNRGGIRNNAFPIMANEAVTVNKIFEIMPFDNGVKMVSIKGNIVRSLINNSGELIYSSSVLKEANNIYINGIILEDNQIYRIAVIDYIFDKDTYPFKKGSDIVNTGILFRDLLIANIEEKTLNNETWNA